MLLQNIKSLLFTVLVLGVFCMPARLDAQDQQQQNEPVEKLGGTGKSEDLFRFFGMEDPLVFRYISMPYDAIMNINLKEFTIELGYILLLLLPLALFLSPKVKPVVWGSIVLLLILFLTISIGTTYTKFSGAEPDQIGAHLSEAMTNSDGLLESVQLAYKWPFVKLFVPLHKSVSAISTKPDWFTYPFLSGLFVFILFLLYQQYKSLVAEKKGILLFAFFYGWLWLLLAAGLPWYGIMIFPLGIMFTVYVWGKKDDEGLFPMPIRRGLLYTFAGIWLLMSLSYRMTNYDASSEKRAAQVFYPPLALYRNGTIDEEKVTDMFRQGYPTVAKIINQETESLVYHAGTQLPYFIKKSDSRCMQDNFFESFIYLKRKCNDERNLMNQVLRKSGFRYFIVDLKLPLIDKTPEQTLKKKFNEFMNYMYQNSEIELLATDRQIQLNSNGQVANEVFLNKGKLVKAGTFAVYRFK